jgi:hypothetical protein
VVSTTHGSNGSGEETGVRSMDFKQFDELVARLASAATRRNAVKGVVGGALASVGVSSVASAAKKGKGKAKGNGSGKGKGKGKETSKGGDNGSGNGQEKMTICHKGKTISVAEPAVQAHLKHGDTEGPCYGDPEP